MTDLTQTHSAISLLSPLRQWLEDVEIRDPNVARLLCKLIPAQCPFERDIKLFKVQWVAV